jgi:hypothetical protein
MSDIATLAAFRLRGSATLPRDSFVPTTRAGDAQVNIKRFMLATATLASIMLAVPSAALAATGKSSTPASSAPTTSAALAATGKSSTPASSAPTTKRPRILRGELTYTPRLALPGCRSEDGFNGHVEWYSSFTLASPWIEAWGEVWDECGTTAHVYLSWYSPTYHNPDIGSAGRYTTNGVNYPKDYLIGNPGTIRVTVCAWWQGNWRCGQPEPGF